MRHEHIRNRPATSSAGWSPGRKSALQCRNGCGEQAVTCVLELDVAVDHDHNIGNWATGSNAGGDYTPARSAPRQISVPETRPGSNRSLPREASQPATD